VQIENVLEGERGMIQAQIDSAPAAEKLAQWRDALRARLARAFAEGAEALAGGVRAKLSGAVLRPRSGALRAAIRAGLTENDDGFEARVWSTLPYARIQEYGGRVTVPAMHAVQAKALTFSYGGRLVFARHTRAHAVSIPERSTFRSSLKEFAPAFAQSIARIGA
jgi:phage gpG-like protein